MLVLFAIPKDIIHIYLSHSFPRLLDFFWAFSLFVLVKVYNLCAAACGHVRELEIGLK